jgi:hypothetical protein
MAIVFHSSDTRKDLALIGMGKRFCAAAAGMSLADYDPDYRRLLHQLFGKDSATLLSACERDVLIKHFKAKGFVIKPQGKPAAAQSPRARQIAKMRAMWWSLVDVSAVPRPVDTAQVDAHLLEWGKAQLKNTPMRRLDSLKFASNGQVSVLIERLKAWQTRVGAAAPK